MFDPDTVYDRDTLPCTSIQDRPLNGGCKVSLIRKGHNSIIITSQKPLNNEQMRNLYWIIFAMTETGKTWSELVKIMNQE